MPNDPTTRLQQTIVQQVLDVGKVVDDVVNRLKGVLGDAIQGVFEPVAAALQGALHLITQLVGGLLGDLTTPQDAIRGFWEEWNRLAKEDNGPGTALTRWINANWATHASAQLSDSIGPHADTLFGNLLGDKPKPPHVSDLYDDFKSKPGWYQGFIQSAATVINTTAWLQALQVAELSAFQQAAFIDDQVTPLTLQQLAQAAVQNQVGQDFASQQAARLGITPELFDIVFRTTGNPPAPETMLELWRRGVTDEAGVDQAIRESALKDKYIAAIKELRFVLPSPQDLVRFLVRDAFDDTVARDLQTDTDFEQKFDPALFFKVGLSPELARQFWRAHWQLPSPGQLFEMHQRTTDSPGYQSEPVTLPSGATVHRGLSAEFVKRTLQINDLLPPFLDKYLDISFNPLNRIDARRMYMADQLDDDGFYRAVLDLGYAPKHAGLMLAWMQTNKTKAKHDEAIRHAGPVIAHVRSMYATGLLSEQDATAQLTDIGVDADIIALWLRSDDLDRERRRASSIRDDLHRLYVAEFLSEDDARQRLEDEGFTRAESDRLFEDWRLDLQFKEESDDQKRARELTKSHVLDAYRDRRIDRDAASELLRSMGYADTQAEFWLTDVDWDTAQKDADTIREAVHADYVDSVIDLNTARNRLDQLNVPAAHRDALLQKWTPERRRKEPRLSIGEVTKLAENKVIDPERLVGYLRKLRYQDEEIELLQALWGYDIGVKDAQVAIAQAKFEEQKREFEQRRQDALDREQRARDERAGREQAANDARMAAEQRRAEATAAAEARRAKSQLDAEQRRAEAEQARHDRNVKDAQAREDRARQERDQARQLRVDLQSQSQKAATARQQAAFSHSDQQLAQRESVTEARFQKAQQARIDAEQRREQAQIERENRQEEAKIRAETRAQEARIATENRGERRGLERELRVQQAQQARDERAQAAKVAQEQRTAEARAVLANAQAQAQAQIQQLRDAERQRIAAAAAERQRKLEDATTRRISALS